MHCGAIISGAIIGAGAGAGALGIGAQPGGHFTGLFAFDPLEPIILAKVNNIFLFLYF